ncbi:hypothetical protein CcaverHIS641_0408750 [Cutaneotrichosporon cavernicola]|nr:hypothetical protein CcaverHIS641_0408750 [Cutaneotrichosporon cavernicola]
MGQVKRVRTAVLYRQLQIETSQLPAPVAEKPVWFDAAFDARFTRTVQPRLDANKTPFVRLDRGMRQLLILSCPRRAPREVDALLEFYNLEVEGSLDQRRLRLAAHIGLHCTVPPSLASQHLNSPYMTDRQ